MLDHVNLRGATPAGEGIGPAASATRQMESVTTTRGRRPEQDHRFPKSHGEAIFTRFGAREFVEASDILTRDDLVGPWAAPPIPWTEEDQFDEETLRADVARICHAGAPGLLCGATTGEFYALELEEFQRISAVVVEECRSAIKPAIVGCTSTYSLGAAQRAAWAREIGASAIFVALPYWMEVGDEYVVPFFFDVARASGNLPLCIYETRRAKKALTLAQHHAIKEAVPSYIMVAANDDTIGAGIEGCEALTPFVNVFVPEHRWRELAPVGAAGSCSSLVYWNPRIVLDLWDRVRRRDWTAVDDIAPKIQALNDYVSANLVANGLTDTAIDRIGGCASGFLRTGLRSRGPYPTATNDDIEQLRRWYGRHFADMLEL